MNWKKGVAGLIVATTIGALLNLLTPSSPAEALNAGEVTIFTPNATPVTADGGDTSSATVGMTFVPREPGTINGLRFYKSTSNTGTHTGYVFNDVGSLVASVTFSGETSSGWQTAYFSSSVTVSIDHYYTIAYNAPNGHYASDASYFSGQQTGYPLQLVANPGDYTSSPPPAGPFTIQNKTNYWVDPIFQPTALPVCPCNVLGNATPGTIDSADTSSYELGLRFQTYEAGYVTAVRFYKASTNTGTHVGKLWDDNGTLLTSVTFTGETASGWQQMSFSSPVLIQQRTWYRVSYTDPSGHYSYDSNYFTGTTDNFPLSTPIGAGFYRAGSGFPDTSLNGNNYYVDVVFGPAMSSQNVSATVDASFSFTVANQSSACNGESNFQTSAGAASAVALGHLAVSSNVSGGQALSVASNAGNGFAVYIRGAQSTQNLRSAGYNWTDVAGTYASPAVLGANERFGYTYKDSTTSTSVTNPASATFVKLDNATTNKVMGSTTSQSGSGCVTFDAQTGSATPAGSYTATVVYTAIPAF